MDRTAHEQAVKALLSSAEFVQRAKLVPASGHSHDCQPDEYGCACMEGVYWAADRVIGSQQATDSVVTTAFELAHEQLLNERAVNQISSWGWAVVDLPEAQQQSEPVEEPAGRGEWAKWLWDWAQAGSHEQPEPEYRAVEWAPAPETPEPADRQRIIREPRGKRRARSMMVQVVEAADGVQHLVQVPVTNEPPRVPYRSLRDTRVPFSASCSMRYAEALAGRFYILQRVERLQTLAVLPEIDPQISSKPRNGRPRDRRKRVFARMPRKPQSYGFVRVSLKGRSLGEISESDSGLKWLEWLLGDGRLYMRVTRRNYDHAPPETQEAADRWWRAYGSRSQPPFWFKSRMNLYNHEGAEPGEGFLDRLVAFMSHPVIRQRLVRLHGTVRRESAPLRLDGPFPAGKLANCWVGPNDIRASTTRQGRRDARVAQTEEWKLELPGPNQPGVAKRFVRITRPVHGLATRTIAASLTDLYDGSCTPTDFRPGPDKQQELPPAQRDPHDDPQHQEWAPSRPTTAAGIWVLACQALDAYGRVASPSAQDEDHRGRRVGRTRKQLDDEDAGEWTDVADRWGSGVHTVTPAGRGVKPALEIAREQFERAEWLTRELRLAYEGALLSQRNLAATARSAERRQRAQDEIAQIERTGRLLADGFSLREARQQAKERGLALKAETEGTAPVADRELQERVKLLLAALEGRPDLYWEERLVTRKGSHQNPLYHLANLNGQARVVDQAARESVELNGWLVARQVHEHLQQHISC